MLDLETLRSFGANVDEGLGRCMNREDFYLRMIRLAYADANFDRLLAAAKSGDAAAGFEATHALKGILANLALTPILNPVSELTEALRGRTNAVFQSEAEHINDLRNELKALDA